VLPAATMVLLDRVLATPGIDAPRSQIINFASENGVVTQ